MRGESGTHENKRRRIGASGQQEWEMALNKTEGTRAQDTHGRGETTQGLRQQRCRAQQQWEACEGQTVGAVQ